MLYLQFEHLYIGTFVIWRAKLLLFFQICKYFCKKVTFFFKNNIIYNIKVCFFTKIFAF